MKNRILFTLITLLGVTGCLENVTAPESLVPSNLVVTPVATQLERGETVTVAAQVLDQFGNEMTDIEVLWESNNTTVATVTSTGQVTANTIGQAQVTAISGQLRTPITVFVVAETVASVVIGVTLPSAGLVVGNSVAANTTALSARGDTITEFATTWTSSAPAVATVSSSGIITALTEGTATVSAMVSGTTSTVQVTTRLVPVASVALSLPGAPAYVGRTIQVPATLLSVSGDTLTSSQRSFTWASADTSVAVISSTGTVTGVSEGTSRISLIVSSANAVPVVGFVDVTVSRVAIDAIEIVADTTTLAIGDRREFLAQALDEDENVLTVLELDGRVFSWSVTSTATLMPIIVTPGVYTPHFSRWYTAVAEGIVTVIAEVDGVSGMVEVEVVSSTP